MDATTTSNTPRREHVVERGPDRRIRRRYVFHDRRTGFDRREGAGTGWWTRLLRGLRDRPRLLEILLVLLVALNLADLVFTRLALDAGAYETNPIMSALFDNGFVAAAGLKVLVSLFVVFVVLAFRRHRRMLALVVGVTALYSGVFVYHLFTTPLF